MGKSDESDDRIRLGVTELQVRGKVLEKLAHELGGVAAVANTRAFDTHIKNNCDLHGKGSHIKGAGPNYLKGAAIERPEDFFSRPVADLTVGELLTTIGQLGYWGGRPPMPWEATRSDASSSMTAEIGALVDSISDRVVRKLQGE